MTEPCQVKILKPALLVGWNACFTLRCCVWIVAVFFFVPAYGENPDGANYAVKYAQHKLADSNEWIRSTALDVVATADAEGERDRLWLALDDPSPDVRATAIRHLIGVTLNQRSAKIRACLEEAGKHVKAARQKEPNTADSWNLLEWEAVEALIAGGNDEERMYAEAFIRRTLADRSNNISWDPMAELVGKYQLHGLAPTLKEPAPPLTYPPIRLISLAKLGDPESLRQLREGLADRGFLIAVLRDGTAVKLLGITKKELEPHLNAKDKSLKTAAAVALARIGDSNALHDLMRQVVKEGGTNDQMQIVAAAGEAGDRSLLTELSQHLNRVKERDFYDVQEKLIVALAIAKIEARHPERP